MSDDKPMRMDAYFYGFEFTGEECVDRVLSAVACAGKAFHHTQAWADEDSRLSPYEPFLRGGTVAEWIQNAAIDATAEVTRLRQALGEACDVAGWYVRRFSTDKAEVDRIAEWRALASKETP